MSTPVVSQQPFTEDQIRRMREYQRLFYSDAAEAKKIGVSLAQELGRDEEKWKRLYYSVQPAEQPKTKTSAGKQKVRKPARRVSRSPETWRILSNYPRYEISSHGRVRSVDRVRSEDWLKPRRRWFRGMCVDSVVLLDKDGIRRERDIGWLLIAAGFMQRPKWMDQRRGEVSSVE